MKKVFLIYCFRSHKKVMKHFRHYIINGSDKQQVFTPPPKTFSVYKNEDDDDDDDDENMDQKANEVEKKLKMNQDDGKRKEEVSKESPTKMDVSDKSEPGSSNQIADTSATKKVPRPGSGPDPSKPKCRKAKDVRRERALRKLEAKGIAAPKTKPKPPAGVEKSIEDFLSEPFPENSKHKFEIRILNAQTTNEEFMKSFEESLQVEKCYKYFSTKNH
jgi:arginine-tRNA-protein transferase